jgi:branched-chain amino acid aminotransferase
LIGHPEKPRLIWHRGEIIPASELSIPCLDRTFEHGLGLFETFRTWGGRARSLPLHNARLYASTGYLDLPLSALDLPRHLSITKLLEAVNLADAVLRVTASGGLDREDSSLVWMTARPLPVERMKPWRLRASWRVGQPSPLAAHKTLNYWRNRMLHEAASHDGFDEDLGRNARGAFLEGTRSNLFALRGNELYTPAVDGSILPGITRQLVLERAAEIGLRCVESAGGLDEKSLLTADAIFLTNAVRGIKGVGRIDFEGNRWTGPAYGTTVRRLIHQHQLWLQDEDQ